jgi:hypothetical protein
MGSGRKEPPGHGMRLVSPTYGETLTQGMAKPKARNGNDLTGRLCQPKEGGSMVHGESDQSILLRGRESRLQGEGVDRIRKRMLKERIDDASLIWLIRKWLKAGVLDTDGTVVLPEMGSPQGGIISPVLSNLYLHYALDLWFEKVVKPRCLGDAYLCRYADDYVCLFRYKEDAERFFQSLGPRMGKFGLELASDKTRILSFSRFRKEEKTCFAFLGFEFRWGVGTWGGDMVVRRTSPKKFRLSLANLTAWCKKNPHLPLKRFFRILNAKLLGYLNKAISGSLRRSAIWHGLPFTTIAYK